MDKMKVIIVGAGNRACSYSEYANLHPEKIEIVAIAEPNDENAEYFLKNFKVTNNTRYLDYKDLLSEPKMADYAFICTQDKMHFEPAIMALQKGYNLLLEKPIAPTKAECLEIARVAKEKNLNVTVCHVLRYTTIYNKIKEIVESGVLGEITGLVQRENVGHAHMAHSFVRGNWHKQADSNPMIIAKCCHDLDLIRWIMGKSPKKLSSFGSLMYFNEAHAPKGSKNRCLDDCPHAETCQYFAPNVYLRDHTWLAPVVFPGESEAEILENLKTSPYGRCVFHNDNDVVDHQTVTMEFENGAIAELIMTPFRYEGNRETCIMGTQAELRADTENGKIIVTRYCDGHKDIYDVNSSGKHFGGDMGLMTALVDGYLDGKLTSSTIDASIDSHLMAWAAEKSRLSGETTEF